MWYVTWPYMRSCGQEDFRDHIFYANGFYTHSTIKANEQVSQKIIGCDKPFVCRLYTKQPQEKSAHATLLPKEDRAS